jgi:hypothetical protein
MCHTSPGGRGTSAESFFSGMGGILSANALLRRKTAKRTKEKKRRKLERKSRK